MTQCKRLGCLAIAALLLLPAAGQTRNKAERRSADKHATSQPHESFGRMPAAIDRTVKRQNSPQDMLQVDITHSAASGGKSVSYVRAVWGDLDNQIKGGRQYYSDWDGNLVIDNGAGFVPDSPASAEGNGLRNMRSRMAEIGGTGEIASAIGLGTKVVFRFPCSRPASHG